MSANLLRRAAVAATIAAMLCASPAFAGSKRLMSISAARVVSERNLVETVYGLKLRATESVEDLVAADFTEQAESKTSAVIRGIRFEETSYDREHDLAKVVASVQLPSITNVNGVTVNLQGKTFRRVGFGTATPGSAGPLKALRAAEIDAYKQLMKRVVGFTLDSRTSVENFMLKSDSIKTKVLATLFMAELVDYGWEDTGDAWVKLRLDLKELTNLLGQKVVDFDGDAIEAVGLGASVEQDSATPPPVFLTAK